MMDRLTNLSEFKDWLLVVIVAVCGWFIVRSADSMQNDFSGMRSELTELTASVQNLNIKLTEAIVTQRENSKKLDDHEGRLRHVERNK